MKNNIFFIFQIIGMISSFIGILICSNLLDLKGVKEVGLGVGFYLFSAIYGFFARAYTA